MRVKITTWIQLRFEMRAPQPVLFPLRGCGIFVVCSAAAEAAEAKRKERARSICRYFTNFSEANVPPVYRVLLLVIVVVYPYTEMTVT